LTPAVEAVNKGGNPVFRNDSTTVWAGGKVVGEVAEGKFIKRVRGSRHMLREPKGWGFDLGSIESVRNLGAETVEIHDTETDTVYSASIARIQQKGFRFDRGHGLQIALPLKFWSTRRPGEEKLTMALGVAA
jgi:hypothetical protein